MKTTVRKQTHSNISAGDYIYDEVCGLRQVITLNSVGGRKEIIAVDVEHGHVGAKAESISSLLRNYSGCRKVVPVGFENGKVVFE